MRCFNVLLLYCRPSLIARNHDTSRWCDRPMGLTSNWKESGGEARAPGHAAYGFWEAGRPYKQRRFSDEEVSR